MGREFAAGFGCVSSKNEPPHFDLKLERCFWNHVEKVGATVAANPSVLDHRMASINGRDRTWMAGFKLSKFVHYIGV
jgi:hypothetical protein